MNRWMIYSTCSIFAFCSAGAIAASPPTPSSTPCRRPTPPTWATSRSTTRRQPSRARGALTNSLRAGHARVVKSGPRVSAMLLASLASAQPDADSSGRTTATTRVAPATRRRRRSTGPTSASSRSPGRSAPARSVTAPPLDRKAAFEATPILVEGRLFLSTPYNHVIALDPRTGARLWEHDAALDRSHGYSEVTSRGVAAWRDAAAAAGRAVPAADLHGHARRPARRARRRHRRALRRLRRERAGRPHPRRRPPRPRQLPDDLGPRGQRRRGRRRVVDRRQPGRGRGARHRAGLRRAQAARSAGPGTRSRGRAGPRRAPARATRGRRSPSTPERGLVFVPTGSASPDYWGGTRKGDNRWANSVVALRAATGELVWGFQVVHHDLWDYDVASQPTLFTWRDGTPAIAITTKMGRVFVLDRETGAPLLPVEERPAPPSDVPGEEAWPTQPSSGVSVVPEGLRADGRVGRDREGSRVVPREDRGRPLRGHLHAAEPAGHRGVPGQRGRRELGQLGLRSDAPPALHEHQPARDDRAAHPARAPGPRGHAGQAARAPPRGAGAAGRHALRDAARPAAVAGRDAVQPAAVGNARRGRPVLGPYRLGRAPRLGRIRRLQEAARAALPARAAR